MERKKDILVEEIRQRANKYWSKYNFNLNKIINHIKKTEKNNKNLKRELLTK